MSSVGFGDMSLNITCHNSNQALSSRFFDWRYASSYCCLFFYKKKYSKLKTSCSLIKNTHCVAFCSLQKGLVNIYFIQTIHFPFEKFWNRNSLWLPSSCSNIIFWWFLLETTKKMIKKNQCIIIKTHYLENLDKNL